MHITIEQLRYLIKDNLKDNLHKEEILKQFDLMVNNTELEYCKCLFPNTDSRDTFTRCNNCHLKVSI